MRKYKNFEDLAVFPIDPHDREGLRQLESLKKFRLHPRDGAINVIPHGKVKYKIGKRTDFAPVFREGRYLTIEVDFYKSKNQIINEMESVIKFYRKFISKPSQRDTELTRLKCSIWEVYDMHKKDNLNFTEIARRLSGMKGNCSNENLKAVYKQVKRAYNKACKIIQGVEKEINDKL